MKITKISQQGLDMIVAFEGGYILNAYLCPAKIPTISAGCTYYPNGMKVKMGDVITQQEAINMFREVLSTYERAVDAFCVDTITQNQFDALVSFAYNLGVNALKSSTLLKMVNANPSDKNIPAQFARWNKGGGVVLAGLVLRRKSEADLYCK